MQISCGVVQKLAIAKCKYLTGSIGNSYRWRSLKKSKWKFLNENFRNFSVDSQMLSTNYACSVWIPKSMIGIFTLQPSLVVSITNLIRLLTSIIKWFSLSCPRRAAHCQQWKSTVCLFSLVCWTSSGFANHRALIGTWKQRWTNDLAIFLAKLFQLVGELRWK